MKIKSVFFLYPHIHALQALAEKLDQPNLQGMDINSFSLSWFADPELFICNEYTHSKLKRAKKGGPQPSFSFGKLWENQIT